MATSLKTPTGNSLIDEITWAPAADAPNEPEDHGDIAIDLGSGYALTVAWLIARLTAVVIIAIAVLYGVLALMSPALSELTGLLGGHDGASGIVGAAAALSGLASLGYLAAGSLSRG